MALADLAIRGFKVFDKSRHQNRGDDAPFGQEAVDPGRLKTSAHTGQGTPRLRQGTLHVPELNTVSKSELRKNF